MPLDFTSMLLPEDEKKRAISVLSQYSRSWILDKTLLPLSTIWQWPKWLAHSVVNKISRESYRLLSNFSDEEQESIILPEARRWVFTGLWYDIVGHYKSFWWGMAVEVLGEKLCLLDTIHGKGPHAVSQNELDRILAQELQIPLADYMSLKAFFLTLDPVTSLSFKWKIGSPVWGSYSMVFTREYWALNLPEWMVTDTQHANPLEPERVDLMIPRELLEKYRYAPVYGTSSVFESNIIIAMPHPIAYKRKSFWDDRPLLGTSNYKAWFTA